MLKPRAGAGCDLDTTDSVDHFVSREMASTGLRFSNGKRLAAERTRCGVGRTGTGQGAPVKGAPGDEPPPLRPDCKSGRAPESVNRRSSCVTYIAAAAKMTTEPALQSLLPPCDGSVRCQTERRSKNTNQERNTTPAAAIRILFAAVKQKRRSASTRAED